MNNEKQAIVVNPCVECWPCVVCRQFAEVGGACKAGRTTTQCTKEIASNNGRLPIFMIKDPFVEEGKEAFEQGVDKEDCPYEIGTDGECGWRLGWNQAQLDKESNADQKNDIVHDTAEMHRCLITGKYTDVTDQTL